MKVAVTGTLGAGKTTVCRFFKELGAYSISSDTIVHQLLSTKTETGQRVITLLGEEIIVEGQIDRDKIATLVFKNEKKLESLEKIVHPEVLKELKKTYSKISKHPFPLFIAEVPLLFESGLNHFFDTIITVVSNTKRGEREIKMEKERKQRMLSQEELIKRSDIILENNGSMRDLNTQVQKTYKQLTQ
ncbi:MAG: Dephospho-CoA kinase [Chlamydiales bacterium]|nr:Dephospho-CoA kinase [Chlamydiales bacterium]MCH9619705.1 Dephospho-CoA kinase [Chlamydiales bacterium]MCH9623311.1 Dephospho-CoA kinase [Chlamydiales bacterium]